MIAVRDATLSPDSLMVATAERDDQAQILN